MALRIPCAWAEREHRADQRGSQLRFAGDGAEAWREEIDDQRTEQHPERAESAGEDEQHRTGDVRKLACLFAAFRSEKAGERRNECRRQSTFGEQFAGQAGDAKAEHVSIVNGARAEERTEDTFTNKSGEPAGGNGGGDDARGLEQPVFRDFVACCRTHSSTRRKSTSS